MTADPSNKTSETSRYELVRLLGAGGAGAVYLAFDREAGEHVALKKLSRMNPVSVLRFKREFRALANIHHRNLVQLYELEHAHDGWFLTMELVEGVELLRGLGTIQAPPEAATWDHRDARVAQLENDEARLSKLVDAFSQLAQAIHAIHQAGFLHRDLKPSNVMVEREGRVVVLDFGLVRELMPSTIVSMDGVTAGTPAYMPPEQARGGELSEASDWYAFGVMLYEALSGALPIDGRFESLMFTRCALSASAVAVRSRPPSSLASLATLEAIPFSRHSSPPLHAQSSNAGRLTSLRSLSTS